MKGNKMRLEYKNEAENAFKFWEVKIECKTVITTYCRIDKTKNPAETENKFSSEEAAKKYAEKKIREKMNKGYVEIN